MSSFLYVLQIFQFSLWLLIYESIHFPTFLLNLKVTTHFNFASLMGTDHYRSFCNFHFPNCQHAWNSFFSTYLLFIYTINISPNMNLFYLFFFLICLSFYSVFEAWWAGILTLSLYTCYLIQKFSPSYEFFVFKCYVWYLLPWKIFYFIKYFYFFI